PSRRGRPGWRFPTAATAACTRTRPQRIGRRSSRSSRRCARSAERARDRVRRLAGGADPELVDHRLDVVDEAHFALELACLLRARDAALQIDPAALAQD